MKEFGIDLRGNISVGQDNQYDVGDSTHRLNTVHANTFDGVATSAQYADLAEMYLIRGKCEVGDVILFNTVGEEDGLVSNQVESDKVLGVVSSNPGFLLDKDLPRGTPVALRGKVLCKVIGPVRKGDRLVSALDGCAKVATSDKGQTVGIALQESSVDEIKKIIIRV